MQATTNIVSRGNQDLWTAIQEASAQRDVAVQWIASHEENIMHSVDATMACFIGLNTLADGVAEVAADMCDYPDTVPALTSWVEGKSWAIRHRAALATLDAIEKDPIARVPPPRRVKPTLVDLKAASEHEVFECGNSLTCCRCGQRAPRRPAPLKRWLQLPCLVGHRITLSDGTHRMVPVEGQGRLHHLTTHASHNCTLNPNLDTWICLACGFYGSDVFKQLAQPCSGVSNQTERDNNSM